MPGRVRERQRAWNGSWIVSFVTDLVAPALNGNRAEDDDASQDLLDLALDVLEREQVEYQGERDHAEERADHRAAAAGQAGPADHDRGDRVELEPEADHRR